MSNEDMERILLSGQPFGNVAGIEDASLATLRASLASSHSNIFISKDEPDNAPIILFDTKAEKIKIEKGLQKLLDLYLLGDAISEKNYLSKKYELETELAKVNEAIRKEYMTNIKNASFNLDFINNVQFILLSNRLELGEPIIFNDVISESGRELLYNFICSTIEDITINSHDVETITFINGLSQRFINRS